jgi:AcrR family transcriptional regulator
MFVRPPILVGIPIPSGILRKIVVMSAHRREPPKRLSRSEEQARTRQRLLVAAGEVIAERGLDRASLEEMAAQAGLTKGAIYSNFASKSDVVVALIDAQLESNFQGLETAIDRSAELAQQSTQAADAWRATLAESEESFLLSIEFALYLARQPDIRDRFAEHYKRLRSKYAQIVRDYGASQDGELPLPAEQMSIVYMAMIQGMSLAKLTQPDAVPDELFAKALELIAAGSRQVLDERRRKPSHRASTGQRKKGEARQ